uniref:PAS domain-containing protein n=1 Tax=Ditylenchus dipsaci TaxID=166011 RepID=A0A915ENC6_9BILA
MTPYSDSQEEKQRRRRISVQPFSSQLTSTNNNAVVRRKRLQHYLRSIKHLVKETTGNQGQRPTMKLSTLEALDKAVQLIRSALANKPQQDHPQSATVQLHLYISLLPQQPNPRHETLPPPRLDNDSSDPISSSQSTGRRFLGSLVVSLPDGTVSQCQASPSATPQDSLAQILHPGDCLLDYLHGKGAQTLLLNAFCGHAKRRMYARLKWGCNSTIRACEFLCEFNVAENNAAVRIAHIMVFCVRSSLPTPPATNGQLAFTTAIMPHVPLFLWILRKSVNTKFLVELVTLSQPPTRPASQSAVVVDAGQRRMGASHRQAVVTPAYLPFSQLHHHYVCEAVAVEPAAATVLVLTSGWTPDTLLCSQLGGSVSIPILGHFPSEITGKSLFALIHAEDVDAVKQAHQQLRKTCGGQVVSTPGLRLITYNGGVVRVDSEWSAFVNPWTHQIEMIVSRHVLASFNQEPDQQPQYSVQTTVEQLRQHDSFIHNLLSKPVPILGQERFRRFHANSKCSSSSHSNLPNISGDPNAILNASGSPAADSNNSPTPPLSSTPTSQDAVRKISSSSSLPEDTASAKVGADALQDISLSYNQINCLENVHRLLKSQSQNKDNSGSTEPVPVTTTETNSTAMVTKQPLISNVAQQDQQPLLTQELLHQHNQKWEEECKDSWRKRLTLKRISQNPSMDAQPSSKMMKSNSNSRARAGSMTPSLGVVHIEPQRRVSSVGVNIPMNSASQGLVQKSHHH